MGGGKGGKVEAKRTITKGQKKLLGQLLGIAGEEEFLEPEAFGRLPGADPSQLAAAQLLGQALSPDSDVFNEFFRTNIEDPAFQSFEEKALPLLSRRAAAFGALGGRDQQLAGRNAFSDLLESLNRERSSLQLQRLGQAGQLFDFGQSLRSIELEQLLAPEEAKERRLGLAQGLATAPTRSVSAAGPGTPPFNVGLQLGGGQQTQTGEGGPSSGS
jgi:hypothetical protein